MINVTVEEHERYGTKVYDMTIEQGENKIALSFPDWSSANHINTYSAVENSQQIVIAEARERIQDGKKN